MSASAIRLTRRTSALQPTAAELASLAERLGYLRATRVGIALSVSVAAALFPRLRHAPLQTIAVVSLVYLAATAAPNLPGRMRRGAVITLVGVSLLLDGVFLAWAMYVT